MLSISLGPLALPMAPLLLLAALVAGLFAARFAGPLLARRVAGMAAATAPTAPTAPGAAPAAADTDTDSTTDTTAADTESAVWWAALAGLLAARALHLALHAPAYLATPWAVVDIRDGGWHAGAGLAGAVALLLWRARRRPALRPALAAAALAAGLTWGAGQALAWRAGGGDAGRGVPAVTLHPYTAKATTTAPGATAPTTPSGVPAVTSATPLSALIAGRPAVVNLWASWCGPCRAEMPVLAAAQRARPQVGADEVRFIFVNQGESASAVQAYLAREGLALQDVWLDPTSSLGPAVGSAGLPTTLFFDAQGRRVGAHMGMLNAAALQARLRELR